MEKRYKQFGRVTVEIPSEHERRSCRFDTAKDYLW